MANIQHFLGGKAGPKAEGNAAGIAAALAHLMETHPEIAAGLAERLASAGKRPFSHPAGEHLTMERIARVEADIGPVSEADKRHLELCESCKERLETWREFLATAPLPSIEKPRRDQHLMADRLLSIRKRVAEPTAAESAHMVECRECRDIANGEDVDVDRTIREIQDLAKRLNPTFAPVPKT